MILQKDKQRYEREMAHYVPQDGFQKGKRQKRKKDPNAPKRPQTAFFVYSAKVMIVSLNLKNYNL